MSAAAGENNREKRRSNMTQDSTSHHDIPLMAGNVRLTLYGIEGELADEIALAVRDEGERLQRIFNLYDPKSELSRLNRERTIRASPELLQVIRRALAYCALAEGRYDISLGRQFLQRKRGEPITPVHCSYKHIRIEGDHVELTHPDVTIDLGSIAKGFIADRMLEFAIDRGVESAFIDARGDMRITGPRMEVIDIQHPREENRTLRPFVLENMAVATSGDYKQYSGSFSTSHIMNPRDIASVTIVAPTTMEADAIATAVFVTGMEESRALLTSIPHAKALIIATDGKEITLNGFEDLELDAQMRTVKSTIAQHGETNAAIPAPPRRTHRNSDAKSTKRTIATLITDN